MDDLELPSIVSFRDGQVPIIPFHIFLPGKYPDENSPYNKYGRTDDPGDVERTHIEIC